jgi:hypothetical protein
MDVRGDILSGSLQRIDDEQEPATPLQARTIACQAENAALFRALRDTAEQIVENLEAGCSSGLRVPAPPLAWRRRLRLTGRYRRTAGWAQARPPAQQTCPNPPGIGNVGLTEVHGVGCAGLLLFRRALGKRRPLGECWRGQGKEG